MVPFSLIVLGVRSYTLDVPMGPGMAAEERAHIKRPLPNASAISCETVLRRRCNGRVRFP